jgi:CheY-like chemotaxis protein
MTAPASMAFVLVVDNHAGARSLLLSVVRQHFEFCEEAKSGRQAIVKVAEFQPDVVVLEILMPGMDGVEATHRIRAIAPSTKIVLTSGCLPPFLGRELARLTGAQAYLEKYTVVRDLVPTIQAVLEK